jgi:radical SAM protein (TIGR01212 family)
MERYFSFNTYLKQIFKERVHRISINAGFLCPNLDGSKSSFGCIFCNNDAFSQSYDSNLSQIENIRKQIVDTINFFSSNKRFKNIRKFIAYFQSYSNTYADVETLKNIFDVIKEFSQIVGISVSTRPDCIDIEKLKLLNSYSDKYLVWIEYGMQTSDDELLKWLNRNHTFEDFANAVELTKRFDKINIGAHIILGLPGQDVLKDAKKVAKLGLHGVKLHNLHVLKNTQLEQLYYQGEIKILDINEYIDIVCKFLEYIPENVVILRLVSSAKKELLIAPQWMNNKTAVVQMIQKKLEEMDTYQGKHSRKILVSTK